MHLINSADDGTMEHDGIDFDFQGDESATDPLFVPELNLDDAGLLVPCASPVVSSTSLGFSCAKSPFDVSEVWSVSSTVPAQEKSLSFGEKKIENTPHQHSNSTDKQASAGKIIVLNESTSSLMKKLSKSKKEKNYWQKKFEEVCEQLKSSEVKVKEFKRKYILSERIRRDLAEKLKYESTKVKNRTTEIYELNSRLLLLNPGLRGRANKNVPVLLGALKEQDQPLSRSSERLRSNGHHSLRALKKTPAMKPSGST